MKKAKPKSIDEYIQSVPVDAAKRLREMLGCLRKAAPNAEESIKWSSPALSYKTILFIFAAHKSHISLHPSPAAIRAFSRELEGFKTLSSTIQFPLDKPLPVNLIKKIADYRVREVMENGASWM